MLSCIGFNLIPAHIIGVGQHIKDRIIDPVKVSFRIRAGIRIAFRFFTKADLLFCSQSNTLQASPCSFNVRKAFSATVLVIVLAVR